MKIQLKKLDFKYAEDIKSALSFEEIRKNLRDLPSPYTLGHANEFIAAINSDKNSYAFIITADERFAGCISATRQQNIHSRTAEVGYYIVPELWNNGIATQALKLLSKFIFEETDILRMYAEPFARNTASCRVLEKAGFLFEGTLRQNAFKCGVAEDMKMYSLLKTTT